MKVRFLWFIVISNTVLLVEAKLKQNKPNETVSIPAPGQIRIVNEFIVRKESIKNQLESYAGFVDGANDAKMFFWLFTSESQKTDPLIIWLQGDIGTSSLKGLFENNGPIYVKLEKGTQSRKQYWSQKNNVLYLDTAVGTGFSHTFNRKEPHYPSGMDALAENLFVSLNSFYNVFDYLKNNDLYLAGDGYACTTMTKLAKRIDQAKHFRLKGLIIENGFCDPPNAIPIARHLLDLRLLDATKLQKLINIENQISKFIQENQYESAFDLHDTYIKGILTPYKTLFKNVTHYESSHNLLYENDSGRKHGNFVDFVLKENIKHMLHIPKQLPFRDDKTILKKLRGDLMISSLTELGKLMERYKVLMYYGQMHPEISPQGAYGIASSIKWCAGKYFGINYSPWFMNSSLVGYTSSVKTQDCSATLTLVIVRNAGKDIANQMPEEIADLINKFTH